MKIKDKFEPEEYFKELSSLIMEFTTNYSHQVIQKILEKEEYITEPKRFYYTLIHKTNCTLDSANIFIRNFDSKRNYHSSLFILFRSILNDIILAEFIIINTENDNEKKELIERIYFDHPRVQLLRDYPNSMYFNAFDASVQAGGYNSFHEMRTFGIPTLFYPNMKTGMDDQLARCAVAKSEGWGIVLGHREKKSIERAVGDLLALEKVLQGAEAVNGAEQLADIIINKME